MKFRTQSTKLSQLISKRKHYIFFIVSKYFVYLRGHSITGQEGGGGQRKVHGGSRDKGWICKYIGKMSIFVHSRGTKVDKI